MRKHIHNHNTHNTHVHSILLHTYIHTGSERHFLHLTLTQIHRPMQGKRTIAITTTYKSKRT